MKTVHEVSNISGISIRTLHYYDEIGLLKPTELTKSGYRLYDDTALERLKIILLFRELKFPLADIRKIIDSPSFDVKTAIKQQIKLLQMQKEHTEKLISEALRILKGENADFEAFDNSKMEKYSEEVKSKWGNTKAFIESQNNLKNKTKEETKALSNGIMEHFSKFGEIKNNSPKSTEAQNAVKDLQKYISDNFYHCSNEILCSLGEMYVSDARFRENIDLKGGKGTAEFVSKAIKEYCK